jgi:hypothetical protein
MRFYQVALVAAALVLPALTARPVTAQETRKLTAEDYARAEKFLGTNTVPLVTGLGFRPTWLADGRLWYRTTVTNGSAFIVVDPAKRSREPLFDQTRLAASLASASASRVDGSRLPFQTFDLAKDNKSITVNLQRGRWKCDLQAYTCVAADSTASDSRAPANSTVSPTASGRPTSRTTTCGRVKPRRQGHPADDRRHQGLRLRNDSAGWTHSDRPVLTWSPDSKQIATFQHDRRGVREMCSYDEPRWSTRRVEYPFRATA